MIHLLQLKEKVKEKCDFFIMKYTFSFFLEGFGLVLFFFFDLFVAKSCLSFFSNFTLSIISRRKINSRFFYSLSSDFDTYHIIVQLTPTDVAPVPCIFVLSINLTENLRQSKHCLSYDSKYFFCCVYQQNILCLSFPSVKKQ